MVGKSLENDTSLVKLQRLAGSKVGTVGKASAVSPGKKMGSGDRHFQGELDNQWLITMASTLPETNSSHHYST